MQTSFALWLEARDPELFMILEAEWARRGNRHPVRKGLVAGAAAAAVAAGLGWMFSGGKAEDKPVEKPDNQPKVLHVAKAQAKAVEETGEPGKYAGGDKEDIFRYACQRSFNGVNIFPYYVGGKQEGLIARLSLPSTSTSPLSDKALKDQYFNFVGNIRATMKGRNVLKIDSEVAGQGPVKWEYIAIGRDNPNRSEAGMVEIVLYAQKPAGER
jgi:hypothetical protein